MTSSGVGDFDTSTVTSPFSPFGGLLPLTYRDRSLRSWRVTRLNRGSKPSVLVPERGTRNDVYRGTLLLKVRLCRKVSLQGLFPSLLIDIKKIMIFLSGIFEGQRTENSHSQ